MDESNSEIEHIQVNIKQRVTALILLLGITLSGPRLLAENTELVTTLNDAMAFAVQQETKSPEKIIERLTPLIEFTSTLAPTESAQFYLHLSKAYYRLHRYNDAKRFIGFATQDKSVITELNLDAMIYHGVILQQTGNIRKAEALMEHVLQASDSPQFAQSHTNALIALSHVRIVQMEYDAAMRLLTTAKRLVQDPLSFTGSNQQRLYVAAEVFSALANLYEILQQEEKMVDSVRKTLAIDRQLQSTIFIAQDLLRLSNIAIRNNDLDAAKKDLNEVIDISTENNHSITLFQALNALTNLYIKQGKLETASTTLADASKYLPYISSQRFKADHILSQAKLLHALGQNKQALAYIDEKRTLFGDDAQFHSIQAMMELKATIYAGTKQYAKAYKTNRELYEKFRSNREKAQDKIIDSLKVSNQLQRKDIENQLLLKDNALRRAELDQLIKTNTEKNYWATIFTVLALSVIGLCIYLFFQWFRLQSLSNRDQLTNVFNRQYVFESYAQKTAAFISKGYPVAALIISIDFLKLINDQLGRAAGDQVLEEVAKACQSYTRKKGLLARLGSKEFLMVFPAVTQQEIDAIAAAIQIKIQKITVDGMGPDRTISASMGIEFTSQKNCNLNKLIEAAQFSVASTTIVQPRVDGVSSSNVLKLQAL